jgi:hypothetical protein
VQHVEHGGRAADRLAGQPVGGVARRQPHADPRHQLGLAQALPHVVGGEEVAGDEVAQAGSKGVLAPRHQRRVRHRDAQRVAEQRRDGEPVGQPADHAGLCCSADDADPAVLAVVGQEGQQEDDGGCGQQPSGAPLGPPQAGPAGGF